jgi:glycosyltransferase involved in cell wall biosynthesis
VPKSLLEAAACGRPMIATDTPGCREIAVRDQTALTFPVDDAPALAEALTRMASDAEMRASFGNAARALVEEKFSAEAIGKATVALYESLVPVRR